jgi:hypothetical protein
MDAPERGPGPGRPSRSAAELGRLRAEPARVRANAVLSACHDRRGRCPRREVAAVVARRVSSVPAVTLAGHPAAHLVAAGRRYLEARRGEGAPGRGGPDG